MSLSNIPAAQLIAKVVHVLNKKFDIAVDDDKVVINIASENNRQEKWTFKVVAQDKAFDKQSERSHHILSWEVDFSGK